MIISIIDFVAVAMLAHRLNSPPLYSDYIALIKRSSRSSTLLLNQLRQMSNYVHDRLHLHNQCRGFCELRRL